VNLGAEGPPGVSGQTLSDYFVPAVEALKVRGGSATIEELEEDVAEALRLSEQARAIPHGDGRRTQFQYDLVFCQI